MMKNIAGINKQQAVLQEFSDLAWYPPCIKKLFHFFHILFGIKPNLLLRNYFQIQCSLFTTTSYMYMYMYHYDSVPCTYKKFILWYKWFETNLFDQLISNFWSK